LPLYRFLALQMLLLLPFCYFFMKNVMSTDSVYINFEGHDLKFRISIVSAIVGLLTIVCNVQACTNFHMHSSNRSLIMDIRTKDTILGRLPFIYYTFTRKFL
jgi:hypothetical protein